MNSVPGAHQGVNERRDESEAFFDLVHPTPERGQCREIRYRDIRTDEWHSVYAVGAAEAARIAVRLSEHADAYTSVNLRLGERRGERNTISGHILPVDADSQEEPGEKGFPGGKAAALAAVRAFFPDPDLIIDSGGGIQAHWLQAEPFVFPQDKAEYEYLGLWLSRAVGGPDVTLDNIATVDRVVRVPGTFNWKLGADHPRPVRLLKCTDGAFPAPPGAMHAALKALHGWAEPQAPEREIRWEAPKPAPGARGGGVIDHYNAYMAATDVVALLGKHGWTEAGGSEGKIALRRPGKEDGGTSASVATMDGTPIFYAFSENSAPLPVRKGLSPFGVYAHLEHGGDFKTAAKALRQQGFGKRSDKEERNWWE